TFSQAPPAVRSACGDGRTRALPAGTPAGRTLHTDKGNTLGLTVQVHGLRNVSSTAAVRAVVRTHSSSLSVERHSARTRALHVQQSSLRYESRTKVLGEGRARPQKLEMKLVLRGCQDAISCKRRPSDFGVG